MRGDLSHWLIKLVPTFRRFSKAIDRKKERQLKRYLPIFICLPFLVGASAKPNFQISGVEGKVLKNVNLRLKELNDLKLLDKESNEILQQQIKQAIEPYGYFKARIKLSRHPLNIIINPGQQLRINRLNISISGEGASNPQIKEELEKLPIAQGETFNSAKYEEAKQNLVLAAEGQGYLHSSFDKAEILIDKVTYRSEINLIFNTGPRYYFGQVQFDPTYISPELLRRYIPFSYGKPYSTEQILTFNNQLANSGYFQTVNVKPQINSGASYIPVEVHMQPLPRKSYSFGAGYGTDTGIRGRAGYNIVPVNRAGHKFNAIAIGSRVQSSVQARYIIPGKDPIRDEYHLSATGSVVDYTAGYSNSALLSYGQHHSLPKYKRILTINGLYDGYHYKNQIDALNQSNFTIFPKASFNWLKTKDKLFTPTGYNISLMGLGASKILASHENFLQASINAKAALKVRAIRTRFYFHTIQGFTQINDINHLPLSLALFLGGADNLKGYSFNYLGPGKILTYAGLEIQKETKKNWYLVGFVDSGDVYKPSPKLLRQDVGVGLMWVSPIGPIKMGVAQRIDNHFHRDGSKPKFVVSMGSDL